MSIWRSGWKAGIYDVRTIDGPSVIRVMDVIDDVGRGRQSPRGRRLVVEVLSGTARADNWREADLDSLNVTRRVEEVSP